MSGPDRNHCFKLVILWLAIFALAIFAYALQSSSDPVTLSILPEVPRKGDPVAVTFSLNNASPAVRTMTYDFYINGQKVKTGEAVLNPFSSKKYTYAYTNDLDLGQQARFAVVSTYSRGSYSREVSLPAYPPQVWSSFVSFASFSTSVMSSMNSMVYYKDSFMATPGAFVGLIFSLVLIALLAFREVTGGVLHRKPVSITALLRVRFKTVAVILLIIFLGMVFTRIVMIFTM